jgi:hypothetical protein
MTTIAPERHFPSEGEVERWMADCFLSEEQMTSASPVIDQIKAAATEVDNRFRSSAAGMVASGEVRMAFLDTPDSDRTKFRGVVRQVMVAESAGLWSLCPHTQMIRPLVLVCDPPIVICAECVRGDPDFPAKVAALGHLWNYQCDRCGLRTELLTPTTTGMGLFIMSGHLCASCAADDQRLMHQRAEKVVIVPPSRRGIHTKKRNR